VLDKTGSLPASFPVQITYRIASCHEQRNGIFAAEYIHTVV